MQLEHWRDRVDVMGAQLEPILFESSLQTLSLTKQNNNQYTFQSIHIYIQYYSIGNNYQMTNIFIFNKHKMQFI